MKKLLILTALLLMACASQKASAGPPSTLCNAGNSDCATVTNSKLDVNATASIGGFAPAGTATAQTTATTSTANVALPAGASVLVQNSGTTNPVYAKLGAGAASVNDIYLGPGQGCVMVVGANTAVSLITTGGNTTVNLTGGSGLGSCPTGGGGGGSGGGGAITAASGSYASGALSSGSVASGAFASGALASGSVASGALASGSIASGAMVDVLASQGTVAAGTAATKATLTACQYNSSAPAPTTTQQVAIQCDNAGNIMVAGGYAQGSTTAGQNLSPVGGRTLSTTPTDTTAKTNEPVLSLNGATVVAPYALADSLVQGTTAAMTGTTSTSLVASPGGSLRNYITNITCVNSHATVGTFVTVQDGSGGTALYTLAAAAVFGGSTITFPAPLRQPTAATALFVADVTTGANVICSASGFKAL